MFYYYIYFMNVGNLNLKYVFCALTLAFNYVDVLF